MGEPHMINLPQAYKNIVKLITIEKLGMDLRMNSLRVNNLRANKKYN